MERIKLLLVHSYIFINRFLILLLSKRETENNRVLGIEIEMSNTIVYPTYMPGLPHHWRVPKINVKLKCQTQFCTVYLVDMLDLSHHRWIPHACVWETWHICWVQDIIFPQTEWSYWTTERKRAERDTTAELDWLVSLQRYRQITNRSCTCTTAFDFFFNLFKMWFSFLFIRCLESLRLLI